MARKIERLYDRLYKQLGTGKVSASVHEALFKRKFSKWQKKILLRIIDDKNLICEKISLDSFENGFRLGVKLTIEIYEFNGVPSDEHLDRTPSV